MRKFVRYTLFFTAFGHFIEFFVALYENAVITAVLALAFGIIEFVASTYLKRTENED
tara:strand:+ start:801 stop:971 length:171 start_codon:yes stop_codon:yes gene_type:complete